IPMLCMSNRNFREKFGHISGFWRGKKPLQRNAIIALGHYRDQTAVDELIAVMNDDVRPEIRGTAAWSLGKIGTEEAFAAIQEAKSHEKDERVLFEMEKGVNNQKKKTKYYIAFCNDQTGVFTMSRPHLYIDEIKSPIGTLLLMSNGKYIVRIDYGTMERPPAQLMAWVNKYMKDAKFVHSPHHVDAAKQQLTEYFSGNRETFSFDTFCRGTSFQKDVWQALMDEIPFGKTKTYKEIAEAIGRPKAFRAVGGAVNRNPLSIIVPCHRVIGTNGKMTGCTGGLDKKGFLLTHEKEIISRDEHLT